MPKELACAEYGLIGRVVAGICYARVHRYCFGQIKVVLDDRKRSDNTPLSIELQEDFLEKNDLELRFGFKLEDYGRLLKHVEGCDKKGCREVLRRNDLARKIIDPKNFPNEIAIRCAFECRGRSTNSNPFHIPDNNDWKESANFFEPYLRWFNDQFRSDWIWPSEVGKK